MPQSESNSRFLLCVKNDDWPASLEVGKVYRALPDWGAAAVGVVRVIDESGEDGLYPAEDFVVVEAAVGGAPVDPPPVPSPRTLEQLLDGVNESNLHDEQDMGPTVGVGVW